MGRYIEEPSAEGNILRRALEAVSLSPHVVEEFQRWLEYASPFDVSPIRPRRVARLIGISPERLSVACLHACKTGLMSIAWRQFCLHCGNVALDSASLCDIPEEVHCRACGNLTEADFSKNVGLAFRMEGPLKERFPKADDNYSAHQTISLRPLEQKNASMNPGRASRLIVQGTEGSPSGFEIMTGFSGEITLGGVILHIETTADDVVVIKNLSSEAKSLALIPQESMSSILTAQRALTIQAFRDLFPTLGKEAGFGIPVSGVTLVATDIIGSTSLYHIVGDRRAHEIVRKHFLFIKQIVASNRGALFKTMGDGTLSAFDAPVDAVRAAIALRDDLGTFNTMTADVDIGIKISVHTGPCVAVNDSSRVDYFGTTVNLTGRLLKESKGDVILSAQVSDLDEVFAILKGHDAIMETCVPAGMDTKFRYTRLVDRKKPLTSYMQRRRSTPN